MAAHSAVTAASKDPSYLYDDTLSGVDHCQTKHFQIIHFLTGSRSLPTAFPRNSLGFSQYLQACGITNFSALEVLRPQYPDRLDISEAFLDPLVGPVLLPARWVWPRLVAPLVLLQMARRQCGPIKLRYAYRPPRYNSACGSNSVNSDHVYACAVDVEFSSRGELMDALALVFMPRWHLPEYGLSIGYHKRRGAKMHLGLWAPETERKGAPRLWYYS